METMKEGEKSVFNAEEIEAEDKNTASGETFLEAEEAETLIEECLAMQRV